MLPPHSIEHSSPRASSAGASALPIVALTHEFFPRRGGIAIYIEEMARTLWAGKRKVQVWAPRHRDLQRAPFPFPIQQMPLKGTQSWPCRVKLARYLSRNRALLDSSILWLPEPGPLRACMYLQLLRSQRPKGLVITLHGSEISTFSSLWHRRRLFGRLLDVADRVGVVSRFSRDLLIDAFPRAADRIVLAPGALRSDISISTAGPAPSQKDDRVVILTVARIHPRKGQHAIVEALAMLPSHLRGRIDYCIVGPTRRKSYRDHIQSLASQKDVNVRFLGEVPDSQLAEVYAQADIFAMTSIPVRHSVEGFGLSYLEASAHGLPVIAHRTGGVGDAVRNGYTGYKVDHKDRPELAGAIEKLALNQALRNELGANGRLWAQSFSWQDSANALFNNL